MNNEELTILSTPEQIKALNHQINIYQHCFTAMLAFANENYNELLKTHFDWIKAVDTNKEKREGVLMALDILLQLKYKESDE